MAMAAVDICLNCGTPCYAPFLGRITTFFTKSTTTATTTDGVGVGDTNNTVQVNISTALEIIFEGALKYSKAKIPNNVTDPPELQLGLCINCAPVLMDLYVYYCKFMALTTSTSLFAQLIRNSKLWNFSHASNVNDDDIDIEDETNEKSSYNQNEEEESLLYELSDTEVKYDNDDENEVGETLVASEAQDKKSTSNEAEDTKEDLPQLATKITQPDKIKCAHCHAEFLKTKHYRQSLNKHMKQFHESKCPFSCEQCPERFPSAILLNLHLADVHHLPPATLPKRIPCSICSKEIGRHLLKSHMKKIHAEVKIDDTYQCQFCPIQYKNNPHNLQSHIEHAHVEEVLALDPTTDEIKLTPIQHGPNPVTTPKELTTAAGPEPERTWHFVINKCQFCQYQAKNKLDYLQHKFKLHLEKCATRYKKRYKCNDCDRAFNLKTELINHRVIIHEVESTPEDLLNIKHICKVCGKKFTFPSQLRSHLQSRETCRNGDSTTTDKTDAKNRTVKLCKCTLCPNLAFKSNAHLAHHKLITHPQGLRRDNENHQYYSCSVCNKKFITNEAYQRHSTKIHGINFSSKRQRPNKTKLQVPAHCDICNTNYSTQDKFKMHTKLVHDKTYKLQKLRNRNERMKGNFLCNICGKNIQWKHNLITHQKNVHNFPATEDLSIICETCGKSFKSKHYLTQHLKNNSHQYGSSRKRKYACHICKNRQYSSETSYLQHLQLHNNPVGVGSSSSRTSRSFSCHVCGDLFHSKSNLNRHLFTIHGLEPNSQKAENPTPHACTICNKTFALKQLLDNHLKTKSHGGPGERPRIRRRKTTTKID